MALKAYREGEPLTILIVDDDKLYRESITQYFSRDTMCAISADNYAEYKVLLDTAKFDYILLDSMEGDYHRYLKYAKLKGIQVIANSGDWCICDNMVKEGAQGIAEKDHKVAMVLMTGKFE